jgi:uncharacterized protein (DUF1800 family)
MVDRREFHALVLAALAVGVASPARAHAAGDDATLYLNRLTFGANVASRQDFAALGLAGWLEQQLQSPPVDDDLQMRLQAATLHIEYEAERDSNGHKWNARKADVTYQYLDTSGEKLLPLIDYDKHGMSYEERIRPAREVQAASLIRAVHAKAQLREMMTQFWHDHFNVNAMRDEHTAAYFALYDAMLRKHAFGNFRDLLGEVARSPAMLFYLNNEASRASPANENFARELLELHTLGADNYLNDRTTHWHDVPGASEGLAAGYIDQDVYEAARALTGWSFGDGRGLAEGENAPSSGEFFYNERWHDPYQKRILAVEFEANAGPLADGEKLLDMLANHPGAARFICTKICRRLLSDDPPQQLVDLAVKEWTGSVSAPDQIAKVIRAVVLSSDFAETKPGKLKRPFEFLASFLRATNAEVTRPSLDYLWVLSKAGWNQHECRPPTGHADVSSHWANTGALNTMVDIALYALEDWSKMAKADLTAFISAPGGTVADAYKHVTAGLHGSAVDDSEARAITASILDDENAGVPEKPEERDWVLKVLVAMAALTPQFMFR